jgi:hypothetical protein
VWTGVDSVWEQKKLEARKMLDCEACGTPRSGSPTRPLYAVLARTREQATDKPA